MHRDDQCGGGGDWGSILLAFLFLRALDGRGSAAGFRPCPYCAEPIRARATLCRFCGSELAQPRRPRDLSTRDALGLLAGGLLLATLTFAAVLLVTYLVHWYH